MARQDLRRSFYYRFRGKVALIYPRRFVKACQRKELRITDMNYAKGANEGKKR